MPIIKSAKKKLRQDKKRTAQNLQGRKNIRETILAFKRKPTPATLAKVFSVLDLASKKNIIHPNKSARLKSRLSKLLKRKPTTTAQKSKVATKASSPRKAKTGV